MPICDIWCYTLRITSSKLAVLMGKVESSDVYFLAAYILSSFSPTTYIPFSYPWLHITSYNNNETCQIFLPIYSTYSLFLPIWASNNTSLCISIFWGGKTFFETWRFLETENLDSSLKWALDNRKRFRTITELILSFEMDRLKICLSFFRT